LKAKLFKEKGGIIIPRIELTGPRGSIEVDLILDTGAAYTLISWDVAISIGYDPARKSRTLPIVTANGKVHVPLLSVKKITIQDISARDTPVICHDVPEMIEVSGLLGLSFLRHFRTIIDYRSLTLRIN